MRKFAGFLGEAGLLALSPLLVSIATLASVPMILATVGERAWVSVAIGQALGEIGYTVVLWGWASMGLTRVSVMSTSGRVRYYFESILPRLILAIVASGTVLVATFSLPLQAGLLGGLVGVSTCVYGLNASWVYIGGRKPIRYLVLDAAPRALTMIAGSVALFISPNLGILVSAMLIGSLLAIIFPFLDLSREAKACGVRADLGSPRSAMHQLREGLPIVGSSLLVVLRMNWVVVLSPVVLPASVAVTALADKMLRWFNTGATPVMQTLQVRIPRGEVPMKIKVRRAFIAAVCGGGLLTVASGVAVYVVAPVISNNAIKIPIGVCVPVGIAIGALFFNSIIGKSVLVMLNELKAIFGVGVVSLAALIAAYFPFSVRWGSGGAFWSFALAELLGAACLTYIAIRSTSRLHLPVKVVRH